MTFISDLFLLTGSFLSFMGIFFQPLEEILFNYNFRNVIDFWLMAVLIIWFHSHQFLFRMAQKMIIVELLVSLILVTFLRPQLMR